MRDAKVALSCHMTETKENQSIKAHCNKCGGTRNHWVLFHKVQTDETEVNRHFSVHWTNSYRLIECQGCESIKIFHESVFSEDADENGDPIVTKRYYPPSTFRQEPHWLAKLDNQWHLTKLMREIYSAMQNECLSLVAMGIRAAFEAIMIDKIKDNGSFGRNLSAFQSAGFISQPQLNAIKSAIELGHASIHRMHVPDASHLETALDVLENLIHGLYILGPEAERNAKSIPSR